MTDSKPSQPTQAHEDSSDPALPILARPKTQSHALTRRPASPLIRVLKRVRYLPLLMLTAAVFGVIGLYFQPPGLQALMRLLNLAPGAGTSSPIAVPAPAPLPPGDSAKTPPDVVALGKLLPEGNVRVISPPFGSADATVAVLHVSEGDKIAAGELIASLDNASNLKSAVASAQSTVAAREATLAQTKQSVIASQNETRASLQSARSALQVAQTELERNESLVKRGFIASSVLDQKKATRDQAQDTVDRLKATLARFEARSIDEQPDVLVAARNVDAARSELARAQSDLARSEVRSPIAGTVLKIHVRPGERPGDQGIAHVGNIDHMTAEVEVFQTAIGRVRLGAPVTLTAQALAQPLTGVVSSIGLEVESQTLVDASPAAKTDARVVRATIKLDEASSVAAMRLTNLQVVARIGVQPE